MGVVPVDCTSCIICYNRGMYDTSNACYCNSKLVADLVWKMIANCIGCKEDFNQACYMAKEYGWHIATTKNHEFVAKGKHWFVKKGTTWDIVLGKPSILLEIAELLEEPFKELGYSQDAAVYDYKITVVTSSHD